METDRTAIDSLTASRLLAVLAWAAPHAFARTGNDFDEDAGHDQMVVGVHNFVYIRDLLDRATSNGRYELATDTVGAGLDTIARGITPDALSSMPIIESGAIARSDYKGSPGWAADGYRILLQSVKFGDIDHVKWGQRSSAKEEVAAQLFVGAATLFDDEDFGLESVAGIPDDEAFAGITLVAAHSHDPFTGRFELHVGQSKNPEYRGDSCWHWRDLILSGGGLGEGINASSSVNLTGAPASADAEEISVPVRKPFAVPDVENG
ncbi:hypothetical protein EYE40_08690 [Glaciihabitans arcticus]|uniref:Uncharacterized protein n=1 Tax=Glaciihabitans arcticus TaxID=2668039 RepID=A0A4V2JEZ4_9MICO|nr:hypothetical protein [Glaciihabitans arcticus]TBN57459.1 hypothetical protein EYE40_08690 [Glaciihabitans arcticus]